MFKEEEGCSQQPEELEVTREELDMTDDAEAAMKGPPQEPLPMAKQVEEPISPAMRWRIFLAICG